MHMREYQSPDGWSNEEFFLLGVELAAGLTGRHVWPWVAHFAVMWLHPRPWICRRAGVLLAERRRLREPRHVGCATGGPDLLWGGALGRTAIDAAPAVVLQLQTFVK